MKYERGDMHRRVVIIFCNTCCGEFRVYVLDEGCPECGSPDVEPSEGEELDDPEEDNYDMVEEYEWEDEGEWS